MLAFTVKRWAVVMVVLGYLSSASPRVVAEPIGMTLDNACDITHLTLQATVNSEFKKLMSEIERSDRKMLSPHAFILKKAAYDDMLKTIKDAGCESGGCTVAEIRSMLLANFSFQLGRDVVMRSKDANVVRKRFIIAGAMWISSMTLVSFAAAGLNVVFGQFGVPKEVGQVISNVILPNLQAITGGGIFTYLLSTRTEAIAYKAMEKGARSGTDGASAIGKVNKAMDLELETTEANAQTYGTRPLAGSRRVLETMALFPGFAVSAKKAFRTKNQLTRTRFMRNMGATLLNIVQMRFETNSATNLVQEEFSTGLWAAMPESYSLSQIESARVELKQAMLHVNEVRSRNIKIDEKMRAAELLEIEDLLNKMFYPRHNQDLIVELRQIDKAMENVELEEVDPDLPIDRLAPLVRPAFVPTN